MLDHLDSYRGGIMKRTPLLLLVLAACGPLPSYHVRTQPEPYGTEVTIEPLAPLSADAASAAFYAEAESVMKESGCKVWSASEPRIRWFAQMPMPGELRPFKSWPGAVGVVACTLPYRPRAGP